MAASRHTTNMLLVVILAVGISIIAMLASGVRGGPLDPPGAPASTMKTLDQIPGSWDSNLDASNGAPPPPTGLSPAEGCDSSRFRCVLSYRVGPFRIWPAVLDLETGLVWERVPDTTLRSWTSSRQFCMGLNTARKYGWRQPTIDELTSLFDTTSDFQLPPGNPFSGIASGDQFWSSTEETTYAWSVIVGTQLFGYPKTSTGPPRAWCVRGGGSDASERTS